MSIALGLCLAATLATRPWRADRRPGRTPVDLPALGWIAAFALSALFALDRAGSLARLPKSLMPLLVPLAAFHARDPRTGRRALAVILVSAILATLAGLALYAFRDAAAGPRARGPVGHYMTYAGQLMLVAGLMAGIALRARRGRWRLAAAAGLALVVPTLALTFTRSAWLGLVAALGVLLAATRPRWLPALAVLVALALLLAPAPIRQRAFSIVNPADPTSAERVHMWRAGVRMFRDHPLTGVGPADLKPVYERYRDPAAREAAGHLHSVPVQVAATLGLAGIAALVALVIGLFGATAGRAPRDGRPDDLAQGVRLGVTAALAGFLVAGLFEWNFGDEELLYLLFTLAGIAWAARRWPRAAEGTA